MFNSWKLFSYMKCRLEDFIKMSFYWICFRSVKGAFKIALNCSLFKKLLKDYFYKRNGCIQIWSPHFFRLKSEKVQFRFHWLKIGETIIKYLSQNNFLLIKKWVSTKMIEIFPLFDIAAEKVFFAHKEYHRKDILT